MCTSHTFYRCVCSWVNISEIFYFFIVLKMFLFSGVLPDQKDESWKTVTATAVRWRWIWLSIFWGISWCKCAVWKTFRLVRWQSHMGFSSEDDIIILWRIDIVTGYDMLMVGNNFVFKRIIKINNMRTHKRCSEILCYAEKTIVYPCACPGLRQRKKLVKRT